MNTVNIYQLKANELITEMGNYLAKRFVKAKIEQWRDDSLTICRTESLEYWECVLEYII